MSKLDNVLDFLKQNSTSQVTTLGLDVKLLAEDYAQDSNISWESELQMNLEQKEIEEVD